MLLLNLDGTNEGESDPLRSQPDSIEICGSNCTIRGLQFADSSSQGTGMQQSKKVTERGASFPRAQKGLLIRAALLMPEN
jgi:hypothetical protein